MVTKKEEVDMERNVRKMIEMYICCSSIATAIVSSGVVYLANRIMTVLWDGL